MAAYVPVLNKYYSNLSNRKMSFNLWASPCYNRTSAMAEAGFYYTGRSDIVECYYCGGQLGMWKHTDIPWNEHAKYYPQCELLIRTKGSQFIEQHKLNHVAPQIQTSEQKIQAVKDEKGYQTEDIRNVITGLENVELPSSMKDICDVFDAGIQAANNGQIPTIKGIIDQRIVDHKVKKT